MLRRLSAIAMMLLGEMLLGIGPGLDGPGVCAAGEAPPPAIAAMWDGRDGAGVHAALLHFAAEGDAPGASKLEAGEAAWWLGVQEARAGRADSAIAAWRRAMTLRADVPEGFALIDALFRRGRAADIDEAYALAVMFAEQTQTEMPERAPEGAVRLAWAHHLKGHADSALASLGEWHDAIRGDAAWARRLATIEVAAADHDGAWRTLTMLSARARRRDVEVESLLASTQRALHYPDDRRRQVVGALLEPIEQRERAFLASLRGRADTLRASDGFTVRWFLVPARSGGPRRAPLLLVLAPDDSLASADSLAAALAADGRAVVLLAPRGFYGAVGAGAWGREAWADHASELEARVASDAARVMDLLARRGLGGSGGWLVGAAGECAPVALSIARARKDVHALLLVAPALPVVEVAEYRARLRTLGVRTFVQCSPEVPSALELGDLLSRMTAPGQVRLADSGLRGRGVAIFRGDPKIAQRLLVWLEEKPASK